MKFKQYIPCERLKPFIKAFLIIESEQGMESRVLPDTSIVLVFRFRGKVSINDNGIQHNLPAAVVTGIRKSARLITYGRESGNVLVLFNEMGAAAFFNRPLHELFEASLPLADLIYRDKLSAVEDQLSGAKNHEQRVAVVEQFLLSQLNESRSDLLILNAIQKIKSANGAIRIKELASQLNLSQDPFEKRFRRVTGTTPKQFSAIVRMKNLIDNYTTAESLTRTAYTAGYFDQAHFIKDFKSFTGLTPGDFFSSPSHW